MLCGDTHADAHQGAASLRQRTRQIRGGFETEKKTASRNRRDDVSPGMRCWIPFKIKDPIEKGSTSANHMTCCRQNYSQLNIECDSPLMRDGDLAGDENLRGATILRDCLDIGERS